MKLDLLVIAGQLYRGEYVLKSCTQNKMRLAVCQESVNNLMSSWNVQISLRKLFITTKHIEIC